MKGRLNPIESNLVDFIVAKRHVLVVLFLMLVGVVMRMAGRSFRSPDMLYCLMPWFDQIKQGGGLRALAQQVGDYGLLYQTIISLMTYIDIPSVHQYKMLSATFDVALAVMVAMIYRDVKSNVISAGRLDKGERRSLLLLSCLVGGAVWLLPTVIINSSFWGQCDSMYTFFSIATLYFLRRGAVVRAFVMLGLAFSCKLQAVFFLPFIGTYYLVSKRFSAFNVLISVMLVWLTGIVAFAYGRSLLEPITIYYNQSIDYKEMYLNFSSAWVIFGNDYAGMKWFSILFTLLLVLAGAYVCLNNKRFLERTDGYFLVATWFVWTMVLFLPCMHDRYAYPLDVMLVLLACINRRYVKFAALSVAISLYHYGFYLIENRMSEPILMATIYLMAYLYFSWTLYARMKWSGQQPGDN